MLSWLLVTVRPQRGEAGKVKSKLSSSPGLSLGLADKGHCPGWQMGDSRQEARAMSTGLLKGCWRSQHLPVQQAILHQAYEDLQETHQATANVRG